MDNTNSFQLLLVEDHDITSAQFLEIIELHNRANEPKISVQLAKNVADGLKLINSNHFDGAVIDLRLSGQNPNDSGNAVIKEIRKVMRFPVVIYSGYLQDLEEEFKQNSSFFKTFSRTDKTFQEILSYLLETYKTGITRILGGRGEIVQILNDLFWNHIAKSFDVILEESKKDQSQKIDKILMRVIMTHIVEHLDTNDLGGDEKYFSVETYILPPIRKSISTGDILVRKGEAGVKKEYSILLTPACDVVERVEGEKLRRNAEKFLLADIKDWRSVDVKFKNLWQGSNSNDKNKLSTYIKNGKERYHFLPPSGDLSGSFIDFQSLSTIDTSILTENYERVARVSGAFLKDVIARFSQYYSRQGQPDYNVDLIQKSMLPDQEVIENM